MASTPDESAVAWLTISQTARLLGISAKTARRWAVAGRLPYFTTAGGHRRFSRGVLERLLANEGWPERDADDAIEHNRIPERANELRRNAPWPGNFNESQREEIRGLGRSLFPKILQAVDDPVVASEGALDMAIEEARAYGRRLGEFGVTAVEIMQAFLAFQQPISEQWAATSRVRGLSEAETVDRQDRANRVQSAMILAFLAGREEAVTGGDGGDQNRS